MNKFTKFREVWNNWLHVPVKYMLNIPHTKGKDKDFCIIEFFGKHLALCAFRNNKRCYTGIPFICKVIKKKDKVGIVYKDKFYELGKYGWVF